MAEFEGLKHEGVSSSYNGGVFRDVESSNSDAQAIHQENLKLALEQAGWGGEDVIEAFADKYSEGRPEDKEKIIAFIKAYGNPDAGGDLDPDVLRRAGYDEESIVGIMADSAMVKANVEIEADPAPVVEPSAPAVEPEPAVGKTLMDKAIDEVNAIKEVLDGDSAAIKKRLEELQRKYKGTTKEELEVWKMLKVEIDGLIIPEKVDVIRAQTELDGLENIAMFGNRRSGQIRAALGWLARYEGKPGITEEMVARAKEISEAAEFLKLNDEDKAKLVEYCLNNVFDRGDGNFANRERLFSSLLGPGGWLHNELGKTPEEAEMLRDDAKEIIDSLGIDNWIAVRGNVNNWNSLANTEEVTPGVLREGLFLTDEVEKFFASDPTKEGNKRTILIPTKLEDGKTELVEVDTQEEISKSMKALYDYFSSKGALDYWGLLGTESVHRLNLFEKLNINKYIGEVAFSIMLSHNMLTETSSDDIFLLMVDPSKKRPGNYRVNEARDVFVRMISQESLAKGKGIPSKDEQVKWVRQNFPRHFIPTGLTDGGKKALVDGEWLKWRIEKNMTSEKLTTPIVRLNMMRNALGVLMAIKDVTKPESTVNNLQDILSKIMKWSRADLAGSGWTKPPENPTGEDDSRKYIDAEFCPEGPDGKSVPMESFDWGGRMMLTLAKAFIYSHSLLDAENSKPMDMDALAESAVSILSVKLQANVGAVLGLSKDQELKLGEKMEFINFMDRIVSDCNKITVTAVPFSRSELPEWYKPRLPFSSAFREFLEGQYAIGRTWENLKKQIKLS